jgi:hypothetical protein
VPTSVGIQCKGCSRHNYFLQVTIDIVIYHEKRLYFSNGDGGGEGSIACLALVPMLYACALMNCYSSMNLASQAVVDALNLPLVEHPELEVRFTLCGYDDLVTCDVFPMHMHTCSILLGKPWTDKR